MPCQFPRFFYGMQPKEDAATLAAFAADTFRQAFKETASVEQIEGYIDEAYGEAIQRREIEDSNVKVILAESRKAAKTMLVGYAQITVDRAKASTHKASTQLNRIYVERGCYGRGVAAALLEQIALTTWVAVTASPCISSTWYFGTAALLVVQLQRFVLGVVVVGDLSEIAHVDLLPADRASHEVVVLADWRPKGVPFDRRSQIG
jgi:GNAT superfamily N-acetyltransferase